MTYRVIQWATGLVGVEAIKGVIAHPELELVGAWVHSPDKVGRDVGEICGIGPIGVTASGSLDEICALEADADPVGQQRHALAFWDHIVDGVRHLAQRHRITTSTPIQEPRDREPVALG